MVTKLNVPADWKGEHLLDLKKKIKIRFIWTETVVLHSFLGAMACICTPRPAVPINDKLHFVFDDVAGTTLKSAYLLIESQI